MAGDEEWEDEEDEEVVPSRKRGTASLSPGEEAACALSSKRPAA